MKGVTEQQRRLLVEAFISLRLVSIGGSDDCHPRLAPLQTVRVPSPTTSRIVSGHARHAGRLLRLGTSRCWHGDDCFPPFHLQRHFAACGVAAFRGRGARFDRCSAARGLIMEPISAFSASTNFFTPSPVILDMGSSRKRALIISHAHCLTEVVQ